MKFVVFLFPGVVCDVRKPGSPDLLRLIVKAEVTIIAMAVVRRTTLFSFDQAFLFSCLGFYLDHIFSTLISQSAEQELAIIFFLPKTY